MNSSSENAQHLEQYRQSIKQKLNILMAEAHTTKDAVLNAKKYKTEILNKLREKLLNLQNADDNEENDNEKTLSRTVTSDEKDERVLFGSTKENTNINEEDKDTQDTADESKEETNKNNEKDSTDDSEMIKKDDESDESGELDNEDEDSVEDQEENDDVSEESDFDESLEDIENEIDDQNQTHNESDNSEIKDEITNKDEIRDLATDTTLEVLQLIKDLRDKTKKENPQKAELIRKIYDYILKIKDKLAEEIIQSQEEKLKEEESS